jgi:hypothetical protein
MEAQKLLGSETKTGADLHVAAEVSVHVHKPAALNEINATSEPFTANPQYPEVA